jgi:hypothetical protein
MERPHLTEDQAGKTHGKRSIREGPYQMTPAVATYERVCQIRGYSGE